MAGAEDLGWLRGLLGRFGHSQAYAEVVRDALVADGLPATAWHGELERKIADGSLGAFIAALPSPTGDGVRRLGGEAGALEATFATAGPLGMRFGSASAKDPSSPSRLQSVKPGSLAATPPFAALRPGLQLTSVQGTSVASMSHREIIELIKASTRPLVLRLAEPKANGKTIRAVFRGPGMLGIAFTAERVERRQHPKIKLIRPEGLAAWPEHKALRPGLFLESVQGRPVAGRGYRETIAEIKGAERPLELVFAEELPPVPSLSALAAPAPAPEPAPEPASSYGDIVNAYAPTKATAAETDAARSDAARLQQEEEAELSAAAASRPSTKAAGPEEGVRVLKLAQEEEAEVVVSPRSGGAKAAKARLSPKPEGLQDFYKQLTRKQGPPSTTLAQPPAPEAEEPGGSAYRVLKTVALRDGVGPLAARVGRVTAGDEVTVYEVCECDDGLTKARTARGWAALANFSGTPNLEAVGEPLAVTRSPEEPDELDELSASLAELIGAPEEGPEAAAGHVKADPSVLGEYRVLNICTLRSACELDSEQSGQLAQGEIVTVKDAVVMDDGLVRLRTEQGWLSLKRILVEKIDSDAPASTSPPRARAAPPASRATSRRASVAVSSGGAMNFGLGPSNSSGGPEEENVFHVTQTHMLDQPKELQLKVGDTGISFLHNGRMVQVQPYEALSRWAFEADLKRLVIGLKDPPKELTMFTDDPKTVCLAMQTQATSYAATKRKLRRDTAHASEDTPEEASGDQDKLLGEYLVKRKAVLRKEAAMDSEQAGELTKGEVIDVKESVVLDNGTTRLRCASGWISNKPHLVERLEDELQARPAPRRSGAAPPMRRASIAVGGINEVVSLGESIAEQVGAVSEKKFEVKQEHLKKAPEQIQLKVGGMGVSLYDGPRVLATYMYQRIGDGQHHIESWGRKPATHQIFLILPGPKKVYFTTANQSQEIVSLMTAHAKAIKKQVGTAPKLPKMRSAPDGASALGGIAEEDSEDSEDSDISSTDSGEDDDDEPKGPVTYTLVVRTGDVKWAGTNANVHVVLYGEKGDTGKRQLSHDSKAFASDFERNAVDTFSIEAEQTLGRLTKLRVGHDGTGFGAGWFLDSIEVSCKEEGTAVVFNCSRWLDEKEDDGLTERELHPDGWPYRCKQDAQVRDGFSLKSNAVGPLKSGEHITVLEKRLNAETGTYRLRFKGGWVSETTKAGAVICEPDSTPWGTSPSSDSASSSPRDSRQEKRSPLRHATSVKHMVEKVLPQLDHMLHHPRAKESTQDAEAKRALAAWLQTKGLEDHVEMVSIQLIEAGYARDAWKSTLEAMNSREFDEWMQAVVVLSREFGNYQIKHEATVRDNVSLESGKVGKLSPGTVVSIDAIVTTSAGVKRGRTPSGWISMKPSLVEKVDNARAVESSAEGSIADAEEGEPPARDRDGSASPVERTQAQLTEAQAELFAAREMMRSSHEQQKLQREQSKREAAEVRAEARRVHEHDIEESHRLKQQLDETSARLKEEQRHRASAERRAALSTQALATLPRVLSTHLSESVDVVDQIVADVIPATDPLRETFHQFDKNGDGVLDEGEVAHMLQAMGHGHESAGRLADGGSLDFPAFTALLDRLHIGSSSPAASPQTPGSARLYGLDATPPSSRGRAASSPVSAGSADTRARLWRRNRERAQAKRRRENASNAGSPTESVVTDFTLSPEAMSPVTEKGRSHGRGTSAPLSPYSPASAASPGRRRARVPGGLQAPAQAPPEPAKAEPHRLLQLAQAQANPRLAFYMEALSAVSLMTTLEDDERLLLAQDLDTVEFEDGESIITAGEAGESMYIVQSGGAEAVDAAGVTRKTYGRGDFFGELALADALQGDANKRAMTVVSTGFSTTLLKLPLAAYKKIITNDGVRQRLALAKASYEATPPARSPRRFCSCATPPPAPAPVRAHAEPEPTKTLEPEPEPEPEPDDGAARDTGTDSE